MHICITVCLFFAMADVRKLVTAVGKETAAKRRYASFSGAYRRFLSFLFLSLLHIMPDPVEHQNLRIVQGAFCFLRTFRINVLDLRLAWNLRRKYIWYFS